MLLTMSTKKNVYLLWLPSSGTKAKLDNPGCPILIRAREKLRRRVGNVLVVDVVEEFREKHFRSGKAIAGCAFSSEGSVSPEPWPFSKVDSIFPHVRLDCVLTMGVKTWLDFCSNLSRQCSIRSECRQTPSHWVHIYDPSLDPRATSYV